MDKFETKKLHALDNKKLGEKLSQGIHLIFLIFISMIKVTAPVPCPNEPIYRSEL
jgi:hypothetical protein